MRHNVERLPDGKTFKFEGNELRSNRELTQYDYYIAQPIITTYASDLKAQSFQEFFEQEPSQAVQVAMAAGLFTFPEQINQFNERQLKECMGHPKISEESEPHALCLDDMQYEGPRMDLSSSNINSLDAGFSPRVFDFIEFIDFSYNPLTMAQILDFCKELPKIKQICCAGIKYDAEVLSKFDALNIAVETTDKDHINELRCVDIKDLDELVPEKTKCELVYTHKELTTAQFKVVLPILKMFGIRQLCCRFDKDFDYALLRDMTNVNFELCHNPLSVKYSQAGQMMLTEEQLREIAISAADYCYRHSVALKTKDFTEEYDQATGALKHENTQQNYALAVFPSALPQALASFNYTDAESGVNMLRVLQTNSNGDLCAIYVPLHSKINADRPIIVNGQAVSAVDRVLEQIASHRKPTISWLDTDAQAVL